MTQQRPSLSFLQAAIVSSSGAGRGIHSLTLPIQLSSPNLSIVHPQRCPEGWIWRGCHGGECSLSLQISLLALWSYCLRHFITRHKHSALTVSKLSKESTAMALASLSSLFISLRYFVRHSVMMMVKARQTQTNDQK